MGLPHLSCHGNFPESRLLEVQLGEQAIPKAYLPMVQLSPEDDGEPKYLTDSLEAIQQLQATEQRISVSAITRLVHLSRSALYRYPQVRLILNDIAKKRRHKMVA